MKKMLFVLVLLALFGCGENTKKKEMTIIDLAAEKLEKQWGDKARVYKGVNTIAVISVDGYISEFFVPSGETIRYGFVR